MSQMGQERRISAVRNISALLPIVLQNSSLRCEGAIIESG